MLFHIVLITFFEECSPPKFCMNFFYILNLSGQKRHLYLEGGDSRSLHIIRTVYQTVQHHVPEDGIHHNCCCDNLKSHIHNCLPCLECMLGVFFMTDVYITFFNVLIQNCNTH